MIERRFVGREQPLLPKAASLLRERQGKGGGWDMSDIIIALPGAQAARRLRRLLHDEAAREKVHLEEEPEIVTPAELLEMLYSPTPQIADQKIADQMQSYFAWVQAVSMVSEDDRKALAPKAEEAGGPMAWAGVARDAQRARSAATVERLTLEEIDRRCADLPGVCDDKRWGALARLEKVYLERLAATGCADRDQARMEALASGRIRCDKVIYLVGAQDLNGLDRAMLCALASSVVAVIPAMEEEQEKFDETGSLRVDDWHDTPIDIPDALLQFVDGPAEEADALVEVIAALGGAFAFEEITVGVGDEAAAESLARWFAVLGLPSFSPFGRPLSRVRPAALLGALRDYLHSPTTRTFAALARHPDLETWLTARRDKALWERPDVDPKRTPEEAEDIAAKQALPLLTHLNLYRAECLPVGMPTGGADDPAVETIARESVAAAYDALTSFLAPLGGGNRLISHWAEPIATLLWEIYQNTQITDDPEGRQFARGLIGLQKILQGLKDLPLTLSPSVSGAEALAFVLGQAEAERLPSEPASGAGVEMMGWLELALDDAPVLLLTGLHEGCVPASTGDDSLLPDSLRRKLGLADDRQREARDGLLLRQMIESRHAEGRHIHLIVPRRGADGGPRLPSRLLFACAPEEAAQRVARFADRAKDAPAIPPLFAAGQTRSLMPPRPVMPDPPLNEMSVSAFADYLACPYRFYLRYVLKLEEQDDSQDEMDSRRFGNLLHDCLAAFAKSDASRSVETGVIQEYFHDRLAAQSKRRFGANPSRAVEMQIRQARRRLDAFAGWQADSAHDGWMIRSDLSEKELTASIVVDGQDFIIKGRLDRVDFHATMDQYRILDYKTGDSGKGPEEKHRRKDKASGEWRWIDLQLPLHRVLLSQNRVPIEKIAPDAMGYVLLSSDLAPITYTPQQAQLGGTGFVPVTWVQEDHESALQCAEEVVQNIRGGVFWPPADPPPFPPSRTDPGHADVYSGLCLDSCSDRREWFGPTKEKSR